MEFLINFFSMGICCLIVLFVYAIKRARNFSFPLWVSQNRFRMLAAVGLILCLSAAFYVVPDMAEIALAAGLPVNGKTSGFIGLAIGAMLIASTRSSKF